jgi:hypothetical protein
MSGFLRAFNEQVAGFGPVEFLVFLAVPVLICVFASVSAFRYLRWRRMIEDVPTSRTRSAHQGYVELCGVAELMDGPPIFTPMSRRESVWWSLAVEKRDGDSWRTVSREVSDELFALRDEAGTCIVDADGAKVTPAHKRVTRGGSSNPLLALTSGKQYRYTERFIVPGDSLYVIGWFRTFKSADDWNHADELLEKLREWKRDQPTLLRRFDANRDGVIDQAEWARARREARREVAADHRAVSVLPGVNVIGPPEDARPFLIAAEHEQLFTRRLDRKAIGAALAAVIAAVVALAMIRARF